MLYAPGLRTVEEIRAVCDAVSRPVNVLALGDLSVAEIVEAGAQRVSVGGGLAWVAVGAFAGPPRDPRAAISRRSASASRCATGSPRQSRAAPGRPERLGQVS